MMIFLASSKKSLVPSGSASLSDDLNPVESRDYNRGGGGERGGRERERERGPC